MRRLLIENSDWLSFDIHSFSYANLFRLPCTPTTSISVPADFADCVEEELDFEIDDPVKSAENLIISIEQ
ncbi:hypothetical protein PRIPAC_88563 [Pristionchus pacificus]|uniref:Uncharacterized protein n=1 Tax=Pristionchus pacificus TaxID=54126 RepID=A0A2A6CW31_PRIPA|nr:hypothetical protein PRIPAC_88563 [Pristionchus pacificus]|eukprot:PDM82221.1 hypothetical protein PRIPAC_36614 [Pristionchus pacificus]